MLHMLVVDDEKIERDGVTYLIEEHGFEIEVAQASDGELALEYIKNNEVDILFTDIRMPFMDGLKLSENARLINPDIKIIIFSAYSEFEYAKKAIDINAVHYILKPVNEEEFVSVIKKVLQICENELKNKKRIQKLVKYEKEKALMDVLQGLESSALNSDEYVGYLDEFESTQTILALINFKERFFDRNHGDVGMIIKQNTIWNYDYLNQNECQSVLFIKNNDRLPQKNELIDWGNKLNDAFFKRYGQVGYIVLSNPIQKTERMKDGYSDVESALGSCIPLEKGRVIFAGEKAIPVLAEMDRKVIKDAIDLIYKNYMDNIGLEWIASKVYLTPQYLSGLFKRETGQSLMKFLTQYRMERAKDLLINTNIKISDISEKVGYPNLSSYFCMLFKNHTGMTPARFREREG